MLMLLTIHVTFAVMSLLSAAAATTTLSSRLLATTIGLTITTILSGGLLILVGASVMKTCVTGLCYTVLITGIVIFTKKRINALRGAEA